MVESQYDPNKVQRAKNVLIDLLAEHGHLSATVDPQIRRVPPSSLEITFKINEGPKVKVGNIDITGNTVFSDKEVVRAMKNLHPIGIPHSILFENLFAKTYDPSKLEEDKSRVQVFYQEHGYFTARVTESMVTMRKTGGEGMHIPLIHPNKPGTVADVERYRGRGQAIPSEQHHVHGRKILPDSGSLDDAAVRDVQRRCVLHRQAAQRSGEHAQAVRRLRFHRFRGGAVVRSHAG